MKQFIFIFLFSLFSGLSFAQSETETVRILFIFDASNSMNAQWQKSSRIKIARQLMLQTLDSLKNIDNLEIALRVYGHQTKIVPGQQDCNDTKLEVPFAPVRENTTRVKDKIRGIECRGTTPIALSLEQAGNNDFPPCSNCRNVIILITDGIEACDGDPCAVSKALNDKGIKLKPFIIGIGLDTSYLGQFHCVGEFLSADTEDSFKSVLSYAISQAVNNSSIQIDINDVLGKPKETDVTMSLYNQKNGKLEYTAMHTFNVKRVSDTISINPLFTYKLVVHTTPPIVKENITIQPGTHTVITVDGPQGWLDLKIQGNSTQFPELGCIVRKSGTMETLNFQSLNTQDKYIVGKYDLEFLTLPRLYMKDIEIRQSKSTTITIPNSGFLSVAKRGGPCQILELKDGKETWVCNINSEKGAYRLKLLPGKYKIVYRFEAAISIANSVERIVTITPGYEEFIEL
jgi:Ca-activated chloride channel homolog